MTRVHARTGLNPTSLRRIRSGKVRLILAMGALILCFGGIAAQLLKLGFYPAPPLRIASYQSAIEHTRARPDILDRHGRLLASDLPVYWLYADPSRVIDADTAAERLAEVLPGRDAPTLRQLLAGEGRFVWVHRGLTPAQAESVHRLGLPGLGMFLEHQRVYPAGASAVHVLGHTDIDNRGVAGIEAYIDAHPEIILPARTDDERPSVRLSLDIGVQHILDEELRAARETYGALAALGLVMHVQTGEVLALGSLPAYDPNRREDSLQAGRHNRLVADTYELGSVFKSFTVALALDRNIARLDDRYDIRTPLVVGGFRLSDAYARQHYATIPEIFIRSSNTGVARLALDIGAHWQRDFFDRLGLLERAVSELGPAARPLVPGVWREANTVTASYGHGIAVTPLSFAAAAAALVNDGRLIPPTFLARSDAPAAELGVRVLKPETSRIMSDLLRLNVTDGTGRRAAVPGYRVGGKTGTANKPRPGGYHNDKVLGVFFAAFPMDDPQYLVFVMLDEPKGIQETRQRNEAAWNAAPTAGRIIARAAPVLGVAPDPSFDEKTSASY
jgi:cell division protein FtsI (penicillin-binding protein 3)